MGTHTHQYTKGDATFSFDSTFELSSPKLYDIEVNFTCLDKTRSKVLVLDLGMLDFHILDKPLAVKVDTDVEFIVSLKLDSHWLTNMSEQTVDIDFGNGTGTLSIDCSGGGFFQKDGSSEAGLIKSFVNKGEQEATASVTIYGITEVLPLTFRYDNTLSKKVFPKYMSFPFFNIFHIVDNTCHSKHVIYVPDLIYMLRSLDYKGC